MPDRRHTSRPGSLPHEPAGSCGGPIAGSHLDLHRVDI